jgi:lipoprotein NlpD
MRLFAFAIVCAWTFLVTGCVTTQRSVPVMDMAAIEKIPSSGSHKVKRGESLYSIAWRYGLDYVFLAKRNNLNAPYHLHYGQILRLKGPIVLPRPLDAKASPPFTPIDTAKRIPKVFTAHLKPAIQIARANAILAEPNSEVLAWRWPVKGQVVGNFSRSNKGLNIRVHMGDPVLATAAGKIVYCGSGIRGYGNLIIIKHNSVFLTAYAHSNILFVKQGDRVVAGQKIAEMGEPSIKKSILHFEIRRSGQPVNPLIYLARKS